jgi:TetR/AcrR family transcriptional regulator
MQGKPPATAANDVRTRILEVATRLFATRGFDGTSIQDIAEEVGITRPTLVYHFGSKDGLRDEVLDRMLGHWQDELPAVLAAATTGKDRFRSGVRALLSFFRADPHRARLLVREILDRPDAISARFGRHLRPWTPLLVEYVERGRAEGRVHKGVDAEAWILQLLNAAVSTLATGAVTAAMFGDQPDVDRQVAELVRIAESSLFRTREERTDVRIP